MTLKVKLVACRRRDTPILVLLALFCFVSLFQSSNSSSISKAIVKKIVEEQNTSNAWQTFDNDFDEHLLGIINLNELERAKRNKPARRRNTPVRMRGILTPDEQILIDESIKLKLIERLKNMYVKSSRSRY